MATASMSKGNDQEAGSPTLEQFSLGVEKRLAVLEERTKNKPKTPLEKIKDWGGLISLVIALAYSFPLGIWDRFIDAEKRRAADELLTLRNVIEQSTTITTDGARSLASIKDPTFYDIVGRNVTTRLYVLMATHRDAFERRKKELAAPELLVVGYNFLATQQIKDAIDFFKYAGERSSGDPAIEIEAMRSRAKALFIPGLSQDKGAAREMFYAALRRAREGRNPQQIYAFITMAGELGLFEMLDGDWECGQHWVRVANEAYNNFAPLLNDQGNLRRLITEKTGALRPQPNQPKNGCTGL